MSNYLSPTPDPGEERANEEMLIRAREEAEIERIEAEQEEFLRKKALQDVERDLEENPPLEELDWEIPEVKSENFLLKGLGYVGEAFETVDRNVLGRIGTEDYNLYKARRGAIDTLSEQHFVLGMLGEMFIPDTVDMVTLGLSYIPNRFRKSTKLINAWLDMKKSMYKASGKVGERVRGAKAMVTGGPTSIYGAGAADAIVKRGPDISPFAGQHFAKIGIRDGKFNYQKWLEFSEPVKGGNLKRQTIELFESRWDQVVGVEKPWLQFDKIKADTIGDFITEFDDFIKAYKIPTKQIEFHHIFPLKASAGLYDGLQYMSRDWIKMTDKLNSMGLFPGVKNNLMHTFKGRGMPHDILHFKFFKDTIGMKGEKFFTPARLEKLNSSVAGRLEIAEEYGNIIKRGENLIKDFNNQIQLAFGKTLPDEETMFDLVTRLTEDFSMNALEVAPRRLADTTIGGPVKTINPKQRYKSSKPSGHYKLNPKVEQAIRERFRQRFEPIIEEVKGAYNQLDPYYAKDLKNLDLKQEYKDITSQIIDLTKRIDNEPGLSQNALDGLQRQLDDLRNKEHIIRNRFYQ